MRFVGRIVSVIGIWLVSFIWITYMLFNTKDIYIDRFETSVFIIGVLGLLTIISWQLGKQYDRAKYYSEKDNLTGAYNRRFVYHTAFHQMVKKAKKRKQTLALFLFDIDDLKVINDQYGHLDGDHVIQITANLLLQHTRKSDVVARWGGDEFMVAALDMSEAEAESILKRIEAEASKLPLKRSLQLSAGYVLYPKEGLTLDELIAIADERMYARKKAAKARERAE